MTLTAGRLRAILLAPVLLVGACSGGGSIHLAGGAATTVAPATLPAAPSTTLATVQTVPTTGAPTTTTTLPPTTSPPPVSARNNDLPTVFTTSWSDSIKKPVTWPDGAPAYLPGASLTITIPAGMHAYLEITAAQGNTAIDGIQCDAYDPANNIGSPEFVGSSIAINRTQIIGNMPPGVNDQGTLRTPVLGPGTYTVGIVSWCRPPDAVNDPQATYFLSAASLQVSRVPVNVG